MTKKTLRKPEYWPVFEDLCKKLWAEIWECPETKKNGRNGQTQHGVDVYGTERSTGDLIGIQCKGKDEYTHSQLTKTEIDDELKKALLFKPKLTKFYFATTANRDSSIDEYVRIKSEEFKEQGLFPIYLFSWEDIVELIDENRKTHDWYVNSQQYGNTREASITFQNNLPTIELQPTFIKQITKYEDRKKLDGIDLSPIIDDLNRTHRLFPVISEEIKDKDDLLNFFNKEWPEESEEKKLDPQPFNFHFDSIGGFIQTKILNHSVCQFSIKIVNTGSEVLEDIKLYFEIDNVLTFDSVDKRQEMLDMNKYNYDVTFDGEFKAVFEPETSILVQDDFLLTDELCFRTDIHPCSCTVKFKLVSRNYSKEGELIIDINPNIEVEENSKFVDNPEEMADNVKYRNKYIQER